MTCPWCDFSGSPRALHAHLGETHGDQIGTEERASGLYYVVTCPHCGERYTHLVKKAARHPEFVVEFERQIRLVALDMLLHHLVAEHEMSETGG